MSKRNAGWKVIKTLTAEETRVARETLLRGSAAAHADIGQDIWAAEYTRRADALKETK